MYYSAGKPTGAGEPRVLGWGIGPATGTGVGVTSVIVLAGVVVVRPWRLCWVFVGGGVCFGGLEPMWEPERRRWIVKALVRRSPICWRN